MVATLALSACGPDKVEMAPNAGAKVFAYEKGTVNGTELDVFVASDALDRARAFALVKFGEAHEAEGDVKQEATNTAAVLVYGSKSRDGQEAELVISPDFADAADLVFINKAGEAVSVQSYLPAGLRTRSTSNANAANFYKSTKPASIALFLEPGKAAELKIIAGSKVSITPDPVSKIADADGTGLKLYFRPMKYSSPQENAIPDPISIEARVAMSAEDRARGVSVDNDEAFLALYRDQDEAWLKKGFWLKGIKGTVSFAFVRLQPSGGYSIASTQPLQGMIVDIVENASDEGDDDVSRKRWWPSKTSVKAEASLPGRPLSLNGAVNGVLVIPAAEGFSGRGIEKGMMIATTSFPIAGSRRPDEGSMMIEKDGLNGHTLSVGSASFIARLEQSQGALDHLVNTPKAIAANEAVVMAWDRASDAMLSAGGGKGEVALLESTGGNTFTIAKKASPVAGKSQSLKDAPSRFALLAKGPEFKVGAKVVLPWQVVNARPVLAPGAFGSKKLFVDVPAGASAMVAPEGSIKVELETADTAAAISRGLMFRTADTLPGNRGMIFIFEEPSLHSFWMKNCLMDIDVAFVNEDMNIVRIHEMKQEDASTSEYDLKRYSSGGKVLFAVEMRGGWFAKNGISEGDRFWLPSALKKRGDN